MSSHFRIIIDAARLGWRQVHISYPEHAARGALVDGLDNTIISSLFYEPGTTPRLFIHVRFAEAIRNPNDQFHGLLHLVNANARSANTHFDPDTATVQVEMNLPCPMCEACTRMFVPAVLRDFRRLVSDARLVAAVAIAGGHLCHHVGGDSLFQDDSV